MEKAFMIIPKRESNKLDEALALAETAGYKIIRIWKTRYARRIGRGLLEEIVSAVREETPDAIIFYGEPQPSTVFQLMKGSGVKVIDRVSLILEIFVKHAGSREAQLQIEMARIKHELPLIREFIRRSKMGELPGFLGPGGYAVDAYYRNLTRRLARLRRELEELRRLRQTRLTSRKRRGFKHVSLVGYASAGKTTLFNALTGLSKPTSPEYFTTLHPKHSAVNIGGLKVILVDTVGFIRDVPPTIIEAFHSTLEEITFSDAIIFVVDVSDPPSEIGEKLAAGFDTLARIGASSIPTVIAANKIDLISESELEARIRFLSELKLPSSVVGVVPVSAKKGLNLNLLLEIVSAVIGGERPLEGIRESLRSEIGAQAAKG